MERVASILVRLSREADASNLSLAGMLADCRGLAARHGLVVGAEHVEDGVSGAAKHRPEYRAWLADATEHRVQVLIAYSVDRVSRAGLATALEVFDTLKASGARLLDCQGTDSDAPGFEMTFGVRALVAREELQRISERNRAAHWRAVESGRWKSGRPGFGWVAVPGPSGGWVVVVDPVAGGWLVRVADMILDGGSYGAAARWLNREGVRPSRGTTWNSDTLSGVLCAERSEVILGPTRYAALLAKRDAVRATWKPGGGSGARVLSGLVVCAGCESVMFVGARGRGVPVYRCSSYVTLTDCSTPTSLLAVPLEDLVVGAYLRGFGGLSASYTVLETNDTTVMAARTAHKAAVGAIATNPCQGTLEALQAATKALRAAEGDAPVPVRVRRNAGRTLADEWGTLTDVRDQRAILEGVIVYVQVGRPGTRGRERAIDIEWAVDPEQLG